MPKKRYEEFFRSKEEALEALGPPIEWYEGDREGIHYGYKCFYCGESSTVGYRVEQLSSGQLIGKLVCERHRTVSE